MTNQRTRIESYVADHPGLHFNELARRLDLAPGQAQYHLRKLLGADRVVSERVRGRTHYYAPGYSEWERAAVALFRRETARDILAHLLEHGPTRPATVADALGVARSTLEWHLDELVECDLVVKERGPRNRVTLALARPPETATLLAELEPSLPDRFVDRFTRLVDGLLDEW